MQTAVVPATPRPQSPWKLQWLTPLRCRTILALVLAAGFVSHLRYLIVDCPLDLSGDEAYYWDWSRQLDLCYYSKGPVVAYLIRASCAAFGDNMPAVRLPALILAVGTSLLTYWLTLRLFSSDRLAFGAALLSHFVPMFIAGSVLMTIDPPFYFLWAAATAFAFKAIFQDRKWAWIAMGAAVGLGFLTKFSMPLWLVGLAIFLTIDRASRQHWRTRWPWLMLAVAIVFTIPVIIFNIRHGGVSIGHVGGDVGGSGKSRLSLLSPLVFIATQLGMLAPPLAVLITAAVVYAIRRRDDPNLRQMRFLLCIGLSFFSMVLIASTFTKAQGNWPAPAYFTLMILCAYFLSTRLRDAPTWKPWRIWLWATVGIGLACMLVMHDTEVLYRPGAWIGGKVGANITPRRWDPSFRLRGWRELGQAVSRHMAGRIQKPLIVAEKYEFAAELAFYVDDHPKTYCMGAYFEDLDRRSRMSQYDLWPDRRLDDPALLGRDVIFVGYSLDKQHKDDPPAELGPDRFLSVRKLHPVEIARRDLPIRTFNIWLCRGLKAPLRPHLQQKR